MLLGMSASEGTPLLKYKEMKHTRYMSWSRRSVVLSVSEGRTKPEQQKAPGKGGLNNRRLYETRPKPWRDGCGMPVILSEEGRSRIVKDLTRVDHAHRFPERISGMVPKGFPANQASEHTGVAAQITPVERVCYTPERSTGRFWHVGITPWKILFRNSGSKQPLHVHSYSWKNCCKNGVSVRSGADLLEIPRTEEFPERMLHARTPDVRVLEHTA